jgi:hypothetical protein
MPEPKKTPPQPPAETSDKTPLPHPAPQDGGDESSPVDTVDEILPNDEVAAADSAVR